MIWHRTAWRVLVGLVLAVDVAAFVVGWAPAVTAVLAVVLLALLVGLERR